MSKYLKLIQNFLICQSRINRQDFLIRISFWFVILAIAIFVNIAITDFYYTLLGLFCRIGSVLIIACCVVGIINAFIARLHDCNMSGLYLLLSFIPLGQFAVIIWTFFCAGSLGRNRFGDDPNFKGSQT